MKASLNPKLDEYMEASADFAKPIMAHLRKLLHKHCPEVVEEIKWGIPHFGYKGEHLCIFAAHKKHCSFTFWKESLMSDPRFKENPNLKASKRYLGNLTSLADLPKDSELIAYIREAVALNDTGAKVAQKPSEKPKEIATPDYFAKRLAENPNAEAVFQSKSASFRKEYLVWITEAKTDATRDKRIEESLEWISKGKGRFWKYAK